MKRLLILGNGFDLAHDMKTSFDDFIRSDDTLPKKYSNLKNKNNRWSDVEDQIFNNTYDILKGHELDENIGSIVDEIVDNYGIDKYGQLDYCVTGSESFHNGLTAMEKFGSEMKNFTFDFFQYLKNLYSDSELLRSVSRIDKMDNFLRLFDCVLTFNYTNIVEQLYGHNNVIHVHGNINGEILIGCQPIDTLDDLNISDSAYVSPDSFEKSKYGLQDMQRYYDCGDDGKPTPRIEIKSIYDEISNDAENNRDSYQNLIKSQIKQTNPNRQSTLDKISIRDFNEVHIFGHSLGDMDQDIFESISKTAKVICYYYDEESKTDLMQQANKIGLVCEMCKCDTI